MTAPFVVVPDGFDKDLFNALKNTKELHVHPQSKVSQDELKTLLPTAQALIIRSATTVTKELVDMAPNLKLVIRAGEGTDNIDKQYCAEKGIKVANTPGANANSAAEHAIALMFTILRKTAFAHGTTAQGQWEKNLYTGNEIWKKKVGFVGFGNIGQIVAKRLSGFEIDGLYFETMDKNHGMPYMKRAESLDQIFRECDIITIHLPKIKETTNMITKHQLSLMKKSAVLINAARGGIVNEEDLYYVLKEKMIKGAALDVFNQEPIGNNSKLLELDNVVLTPHLGASTEEAQVRVGEIAIEVLKEFLLNGKLMHEVKA